MENRNLQWNKRVKVPLILFFSVNTNHESVAYRSFSPSTCEARGARKVTTGINCNCKQPARVNDARQARAYVVHVPGLSLINYGLVAQYPVALVLDSSDTPGCGELSLGSRYQALVVTPQRSLIGVR